MIDNKPYRLAIYEYILKSFKDFMGGREREKIMANIEKINNL